MQLTLEHVKKCCPLNQAPDVLLTALNKYLPQYNLITKDEVASYLSQCGHESLDFTRLEENLNYSADGLHRTWPRHFPDDATCQKYAHHKEMIANRAYADRNGNGDEASGDGWATHGRGAIQLTGLNNYRLFMAHKGMTLAQVQAYTVTIEGAVDSSCWYWTHFNLNKYADKDDVIGLTKAINGGTLGIDDRRARFELCMRVLG